jgi:hypothetical protein
MPEEIDLNAFEGAGVRLDVEALAAELHSDAARAEGRKVGVLQTAKKRTQTGRGAPSKGSFSFDSFVIRKKLPCVGQSEELEETTTWSELESWTVVIITPD